MNLSDLGSANVAEVAVPHDTLDQTHAGKYCRGISFGGGTAGAIVFVDHAGTQHTLAFGEWSEGTIHPQSIRRVKDTGTTYDGVIRLHF